MSKIRRGLIVTALVAAGVSIPALPASAHTGSFERDCDSVTLDLVAFAESSPSDPNVVEVFRNGEHFDIVTFEGREFTKDYPEDSTEPVTYRAVWNDTGSDNHSGNAEATLNKPNDCEPPAVCVDDADLEFTFNGAEGKASLTLTSELPLCEPVHALLASYETEGATAEDSGQHTVFATDAVDIVEPGDYPLQVKLPDCFFEVDLYVFKGVEPQPAVDFVGMENPLAEFLANEVLGPKTAAPTTFNAGEECPSPAPSPSASPAPPQGSDDRDLAETGVDNTVLTLGLGALMLAGGTGLLILARRRRSAPTNAG